ncbi:SPOR domain-containing protein [Agaribacter flavus]|uniref:SPOR domain-containing protein n=1 Tax=Agaribacter flavus TaxID=1902781 RepID=A0ABV7FIT5_9ALTE
MSSALKNRIVGTVIVVALAVILLPQFLDGEKNVSNKSFVDVPPAPAELEIPAESEFDREAIKQTVSRPLDIVDEQPVDGGEIAVTPEGATSNIGDDSRVDSTDSSASQLASSSIREESVAKEAATKEQNAPELQEELPQIEIKNSGWVIQLGSFSDQANAKKLMRNVRSAGYRVYSRPIQTRLGVLTKVFVGPELVKSELENALPHLKEITGLSGKITEFEVSAQ